MTTRIELTRALEAKGITIYAEDDPHIGPCEFIMWSKEYNYISAFINREGMSISPDLLMGFHYDDSYLHISTRGSEFIIDNLAKYSTEQAAECIARFIAGTYYMAGRNMTNADS